MTQGDVVFINPNVVLQKHDIFTTGIVFMPFCLAHFVAVARKEGFNCRVVDAFGDNPNQFWADGKFIFRGLKNNEVVDRAVKGGEDIPLAIFVYAGNLASHQSTISIISTLKETYPAVTIAVLENSQAVTAYSLKEIQGEFYQAGADFVIMGESEIRGMRVLEHIRLKTSRETLLECDGIGFLDNGEIRYREAKEFIANLDDLPFAAWDLFPLKNYWQLKYSHGPLSAPHYLPLLTSRGCPYKCRFCVIPKTNSTRWRARSARHVIDEMEFWIEKLGVREFHFEDVDPTVNDRRTRALCREIISRKLKVTWKLVSGTKVETLKNEETIALMAQAGCKYISISPESGSSELMKSINKPFNYEHAVRMITAMNKHGIRSQACFILGFPRETDGDRKLTRKMVYDLVRAGVSEIALFIVTPVPGSEIFDEFEGYEDYSQLNFSPSWRQDYATLNSFRVNLYRSFLFWKLYFHPLALLRQPFNVLRRRFDTKMEMVLYRALHTMVLMKIGLRKSAGQ